MRRMIGALLVGLASTAVVQAHALYIVGNLGNATTKIDVVFSDDLNPDERVKEATWKKIDGMKLSAKLASGKVIELSPKMDKAKLVAEIAATTPPDDARVLFAAVDFGVSTKGEKASRVHFFPKQILGAVPADGGKVGEPLALEIVPKVEAGKVRFQVLQAGKPVKDATVSVMMPKDDKKEKGTTDENGWTQAFEEKGRYAATVRVVEATAGDVKGEKYEQTSRVATLVVDVN